MIKAVCFDVHDTLIDKGAGAGLAGGKKAAVEALGKKYHHVNDDIFEQAWKNCIVKAKDLQRNDREISSQGWYSELLRNMGIVEFDEALINEFNLAFMHGFKPFTTVLPGARESLLHLSQSGYKLAVVSNSLGPNTRIDLEVTGLTKFFDQIVISSEIGWRKPNQTIFRRVLELLEVKPSETVFVGDNLNEDIKGAVNAGMHPVLVRKIREKHFSSGGTKARQGQFEFNGSILDSLFELSEVINQLETDSGKASQ